MFILFLLNDWSKKPVEIQWRIFFISSVIQFLPFIYSFCTFISVIPFFHIPFLSAIGTDVHLNPHIHSFSIPFNLEHNEKY